MEVDNADLGVFREFIVLDQAFTEQESVLSDDQVINELSVNRLTTLSIEFKENKVILKSDIPFYLHRTRKRLVINYEPQFRFCGDHFSRMVRIAPIIYQYEKERKKVYENRYRDEEYMMSTDGKTWPYAKTTPDERVMLAKRAHIDNVNNYVIDQLIVGGYAEERQREAFYFTLLGSCSGVIKKETMTLFYELKEEYEKNHSEEIACALDEELRLMEKWGALGEGEMRRRVQRDDALYSSYNADNAVKHTEWVLSGKNLHELCFFNLHEGVEFVDFYNRTFNERPAYYGRYNTILPYEHIRVDNRPRPKVTPPKRVSYTGRISTFPGSV